MQKNQIKAILMSGLLGATVSAAQVSTVQADEESPGEIVHDRTRGELSQGASAPSRSDMVETINNGTPTQVLAVLEYGERVECYECVPALERMIFEHDNAETRRMASWWLRRRLFARGRVLRNVRAVLANDASAERRARAAAALGEFLDPNSLGPLTDAASKDTEAVVRASAVRALGRLNHAAGHPFVAEAMSDSDAEVRRAAMDQVLKLNFFREEAALIGRLADDDALVRTKAARLVGEFGVASAVPALAGLLRGDDNTSVRQAAAWALGKVGGGEAKGALSDALSTENESLVVDAIEIGLRM